MNKNQKKQATKGQRQIYEENKSTFNYYLAACLLTSFIIILVNILFFKPSTSWPWVYIYASFNCCGLVRFDLDWLVFCFQHSNMFTLYDVSYDESSSQ